LKCQEQVNASFGEGAISLVLSAFEVEEKSCHFACVVANIKYSKIDFTGGGYGYVSSFDKSLAFEKKIQNVNIF